MFDQESNVASPSQSPGTGGGAEGHPRSFHAHETCRIREAHDRILNRMLADAMALPPVELVREEIKQADAARREEWPDFVCRNCGDEKDGGKWRSHTYIDEGVTEYRCLSPRCGVCKHRVEAIGLDNGVCLDCRVKAAKGVQS